MKRLLVLLSIVGLGFASDLIQFDRVQNLAQTYVTERFGAYYLDNVITYYGIDELPGAYALVFRNKDNEPLTIVMGARYTTTPINEITRTVPRSISRFDKILDWAQRLGYGVPEYHKTYYFGPGHEYCAFTIGEKEILINANTFQTIDKARLLQHKPQPNAELERLTRQKWEKYLSMPHFAGARDTGYIAGVPWIDWVYGCSPTSASMIFWYWDSRGYGRLVDYFYTHWDNPEGEWNDCANANRELALGMFTDTLSGSTSVGNTGPGMLTVANTWHGYSCGSSTSPQGGSWNQHNFSWIKTEVNAGRPFCWGILNYWYPPFNDFIPHCVTGVGYVTAGPDTFVQVHTTWDTGEPYWDLWTYHNGIYSYDFVITFVPGGAVTDNVLLQWPLGGDMYSPISVYNNIKYRITWEEEGTIDHLKMWYSTGRDGQAYDSLQWTLINGNMTNGGEHIWTCNATDTFRINISGLNSSNVRRAADGSFGRCIPVSPDSSGITLTGHIPEPAEGTMFDVQVYGNYLYIADGSDGLRVADITDATIPDNVGHLVLPGVSGCLDIAGTYLYLGDREDTLRVISLSDPDNPVQVGKVTLDDDVMDVMIASNRAYVAARGQGLVIIDISNPSAPTVLGEYDTPGYAYDVAVAGSYAYVADATKGVRVINVSNPASPTETGYYDTGGNCYGVCVSGNTVYAADGLRGVKVFDATNSDTLLLLDTLDTPVNATKVQLYNVALFVADGNMGGVRAINVADPDNLSELGYIESRGSACNLWVVPTSTTIYLADGQLGTLVLDRNNLGIKSDNEVTPLSVNILPSLARINRPVAFSYNASLATDVVISLYDCTGRYVQSIYSGSLNAGTNTIHWHPKSLAAGIYFVQTETHSANLVHKLVLVK